MRNKHDFEQLVYQKADEIKAKDRKKVIRIKVALSTAAAVCVIAVGGIGAFTTWDSDLSMNSFDNIPTNNASFDEVVSLPVTNAIGNGTSYENDEMVQDDSIKTNNQSEYIEVYSMPSYSCVDSENDCISEAVSSVTEDDNSVDGVGIKYDFDILYSVQCYKSDTLVEEYFDEEILGELGQAIKGLPETKGLPSISESPKYSLHIVYESGAVWVADVYENMVLINGNRCYLISDEFEQLLEKWNL